MPFLTGFDHAIVGVRDLEAARRAYGRLGFTLTPRGRHIGWGTANYCIMFERDYVELLGIVDPREFTNNLDTFLAAREGLLGLAFATENAGATARALRRAGIAADGPQDLGRLLELPAGDVTPRFRLAMLPQDATPGLAAFVCQHLTPDLIRRREWLVHANGAVALLGLTAMVDDPASLAPAYELLCGAGSATLTDETLAVRMGRQQLLFAKPRDLALLYPGIETTATPPPWLAAMTIGVARIEATTRWFEDRGIAFAAEPAGSLIVCPAEACGAVVEFRARQPI
ncbi:MAG: VOC family protein [Pseudomonadota bacterium]